MHTAFHNELVNTDTRIILSEEESLHLVKVLRHKEGKEVVIANGRGLKAIAKITLAHAKRCEVQLLSFEAELPKKEFIHLAIAPTKNMDRLEWFVEKSTEIGVDKISLLQCKNNERKTVKMERLEKIAMAAMKQSQRFFLPEINELTKIEDFIQSHPNGGLAHCYEIGPVQENKTSILDWEMKGPLLIGPEGDFTLEEVQFAIEKGYTSIDLGKNRLRTETAALFGVVNMVVKQG